MQQHRCRDPLLLPLRQLEQRFGLLVGRVRVGGSPVGSGGRRGHGRRRVCAADGDRGRLLFERLIHGVEGLIAGDLFHQPNAKREPQAAMARARPPPAAREKASEKRHGMIAETRHTEAGRENAPPARTRCRPPPRRAARSAAPRRSAAARRGARACLMEFPKPRPEPTRRLLALRRTITEAAAGGLARHTLGGPGFSRFYDRLVSCGPPCPPRRCNVCVHGMHLADCRSRYGILDH